MNVTDISQAKDPDLRVALQAIKRASIAARTVALQTDTGIVIMQGAQLVRLSGQAIKPPMPSETESVKDQEIVHE